MFKNKSDFGRVGFREKKKNKNFYYIYIFKSNFFFSFCFPVADSHVIR